MRMDKAEAIKRIQDHMRVHRMGEYPHIKIAEALDLAISALETGNNVGCKWIPVAERLPEPYKDVLVVENNGWCQKVEVNSMLSNGWLYDGRIVTHWMPLPQAPKDGE